MHVFIQVENHFNEMKWIGMAKHEKWKELSANPQRWLIAINIYIYICASRIYHRARNWVWLACCSRNASLMALALHTVDLLGASATLHGWLNTQSSQHTWYACAFPKNCRVAPSICNAGSAPIILALQWRVFREKSCNTFDHRCLFSLLYRKKTLVPIILGYWIRDSYISIWYRL